MSSISASAERGATPASPPASHPPPSAIVAVAHSRDRTAVASFDTTTRHLVVMHAPDAPSGPDAFAALTDALTGLRPACIHASASTDGRLLAALALAAPRTGFEVRLERSALFVGGQSAARALAAVCSAPARGALTAAAALDEPAQAAALGALASVLLRDRGGDEEDEDGGGSLVESIAEAQFPHFLSIDDDALTSLSIHTVEAHPSAAGVCPSKPGACITTLMDQGVTPAGRALTRTWLLRPSRDAATLASRHAAVAWLVERGDVLDAVRSALRRVRSPKASLSALRACNGRPRVADVVSRVNGCAALVAAAAVLTDAGDGRDLPHALAALPDALAAGTLHRARLAVVAALTIPGATAGASLAQPGALPDLDALHAAYADLPAVLDSVARAEAERVADTGAAVAAATGGVDPTSVLEVAAAYLPQCGFFVRVDGGVLPHAVLAAMGDCEFAFSAGAGVLCGNRGGDDHTTAGDGGTLSRSYAVTAAAHTHATRPDTADTATTTLTGRRRRRAPSPPPPPIGAFYRTVATSDLDASYGDILNRLRDAEAALVAEVAARFEDDGGAALARALGAAAAVDAIAAFATVARDRSWCWPVIVDAPVLDIVEGGGRGRMDERQFFGVELVDEDEWDL